MVKSNRKRTNTVVRIICDDGRESTRTVATSDPLAAIRAAHAAEEKAERARARGKARGK